MQLKMKESAMVSPYFLFFLIHSSQTGIGVLKYQSAIIKGAGQDAWVSVLAVGLSLHIIFLMIVHIIRNSSQGDLISFQTDVFGKVIGGFLNIIVAIYFFLVGLVAVQAYIDILQIWVFDGIGSWELSLLLCVSIYYIVSGGFRLIAGIAFWGVVIPSIMLTTIVYLFHFTDHTYIMPFFTHGFKEYLISAKESGFMYFGFETILGYFPFIKNGMASKKWVNIGLLYTTLLYVLITILTFMYFTQGKLQHLAWPTLTMIKVIQLPFLERFEFLFLFTWLLVLIPTFCIYLWSSVRIVKRTFSKVTPTFILFLFIVCYFLFTSNAEDILIKQVLEKAVGYIGIGFIFGYIPFLFILSVIKSMIGKRRRTENKGTESVV
ncbi:GerAB/ArcD/ProY family transporter [Neobacillus sp. OS1-2]|uniref:GerAB/ArcD/ProY family transporter n=1 Tax=Neobacillus sp. OS1-2 TaxID=3070680 RepID=UPI0027E0CE8B|nr:GerAB/ArcD/ProY family transporter [Neobacillus sp. OS1-2]WML41783.1 GerAB/ArcD/ProY family transporter [Neobacillus sp. OS1-2]